MNTQINNIELLPKNKRQYIIEMAKGMADHWRLIDICWYSDGSRAYIITSVNDEIFPSITI